MNTYTIVRFEHLNFYGFLFGGQMLFWVDEFAWLAASRDFPGITFVTRAMDDVSFQESIKNGSTLRFNIVPLKKGTTSITYKVTVFETEIGATSEKLVFSTNVTFVALDAQGKPATLPQKQKLCSEVDQTVDCSEFRR